MRSTTLVFLILTLAAHTGAAQATSRGPENCSYDQCALRVDGPRLLRGHDGVSVGRLGLLGAPRLVELVGTSDSALVHAREFDANYNTGTRLSFLGALLITPVIVNALRGGTGTMQRNHQVVLTLSGSALILVGGIKSRRAQAALSRALFWHNRDLPR